jgi:hypothetical protein
VTDPERETLAPVGIASVLTTKSPAALRWRICVSIAAQSYNAAVRTLAIPIA